ncbi:hypothetical protein BJX99DRAFT_221685 [Aspergillus californicus]
MATPCQNNVHFKILIAGGSLVGLALALALEQAGIDYELFEKGEFAPQLGASIGLHPPSLRILDQLGVWEAIEKVVVPLEDRNHYDGDGHCFEESHVIADIQRMLGRPMIFMERCKMLDILYRHVKDKSKLHAHTMITGYEETADQVIVTTEDGQQHHGHILIGTDGIHSTVRRLMADKLALRNPTLSKALNEAFTSEYNCVFAVSRNDPHNPFVPDTMVHNSYHDKFSTLTAGGEKGLVFWFLFVKASTVTRTPNCPRFTDQDAESLIHKYGGALAGPTYTVKDLWEARVKGTMAPLEEGVLPQWSHNRVLLMGDAVHKATINPGLGGNLAYEGIARLTNALVPLLKQDPIPSSEQITELFDTFYTHHKPRADTVCSLSGQITRYEAQDTWFLKVGARYINSWIGDRTKANLYAKFSKGAPWLEWLPLPAVDARILTR